MSKTQPLDIHKIIQTLWKRKMLFVKVVPAVVVATYLLTLLFPRYYTCTVELAPESEGSSASGSLSSLASSFGLGSLSKLAGNDDAISPLLYPDLLESPDFIVKLFPIEVKTADKDVKTNYYDYVKTYRKKSVPEKYILGPILNLFKKKDTAKFTGTEKVQVRNLSKTQKEIAMAISSFITCTIDKKTDAISITVKDTDPEVCATVADAVLVQLQNFIIDYRTSKARNDYRYYKKLCDNAKQEYEKSRQRYAYFSDVNTDATLQAIRSKIEDLENDMQLRYNTYTAMAAQAQAAEAKIQENTPAFTPIRSASAPFKPDGPKRMLISLIMGVVSTLVLSCWLLIKKSETI